MDPAAVVDFIEFDEAVPYRPGVQMSFAMSKLVAGIDVRRLVARVNPAQRQAEIGSEVWMIGAIDCLQRGGWQARQATVIAEASRGQQPSSAAFASHPSIAVVDATNIGTQRLMASSAMHCGPQEG